MAQRQIVFDTETTGLSPAHGHRIIELGGYELIDRQPGKQHFHHYLNPEREIDEGALAVHGLSEAFLADKPKFAEIVDAFIQFVEGAELIIHNALFDVGFVNAELERCGHAVRDIADICQVTDSLLMAREKHPGQRNSLDALCKRYEVDNTGRELHGALLDAQLLADVYLRMTSGQASLLAVAEAEQVEQVVAQAVADRPRQQTPLVIASEDELAAHQAYLQHIKDKAGHCIGLTEQAAQTAVADEN